MRKALQIMTLLIVISSCETSGKKVRDKDMNGKWTLIMFKKEVYNEYFEVEFLEGNKMKVTSEDDTTLAEIDYSIKGDTISFNNDRLRIIKDSGKMEFLGRKINTFYIEFLLI